MKRCLNGVPDERGNTVKERLRDIKVETTMVEDVRMHLGYYIFGLLQANILHFAYLAGLRQTPLRVIVLIGETLPNEAEATYRADVR